MEPSFNRQERRKEGGQALFMLTVALFTLCGIMGLAVDLGWSFFVKKAAQSAADAAALAAVHEAVRAGIPAGFTCGSVSAVHCATSAITCGSVLADSATYKNLYNGCKYAEKNGFTTNGHGNRQQVTVVSNDRSTLPPTAPGVNDVRYWVTVTIVETIPQMFSAVLGNPNGQVAARATAGAVQVVVPGSFYALNREGDCMGTNENCGVNVDLGGGNDLEAPGGLIMASNCSGSNQANGCDDKAGIANNANGAVRNTPSILIRGNGTADNASFPGWKNGGTGPMFQDPTVGKPQPPVAATSQVKTCAVLNGVIPNNSNNTPVELGPFNYYGYNGRGEFGFPITFENNKSYRFSPTGGCPGILGATGGVQTSDFPSYFFHGGLNTNTADVEFGSGQYVMVGAVPDRNGNAMPSFRLGGGDISTSPGATNMFITTAPGVNSYPGLNTQLNIPEIQRFSGSLYHGYTEIKAGQSGTVHLMGYQKGEGPASLDDHNGILFWQDRRNSTIKYNPDGTYNCAGPAYVSGCSKTQNELIDDRVTVRNSGDSRKMIMDGAPDFGNASGVLYQPRGSWLEKQGGGNLDAAYQIITGAVKLQGGRGITLTSPTNPLLSFVVALIE